RLGAYLNGLGAGIHTTAPYESDTHTFYFNLAERLLKTQGIIQQQIYSIKAERYSTQKELFRRVETGRDIMEENYASPLAIECLAAASAMSPFHFSRTFKQVYHLSPYQFIIQKRLQKGKDLLKSNRYSVSEVAYLVGFATVQSFSKAFKNAFQVSPGAYK
ncbi:MAG TPA: AraC family transcriptional regulator, partial [Anseongella sp.]|nr:AraC family transcriptional regulator [Anseongella sp.]